MHYLSKEDLNPRSRHSRASASMYRSYVAQEVPHYPRHPVLPPTTSAHLPDDPLSPTHLNSPLGDEIHLVLNTLEPIEFEMFVRDPRRDPPVHLHTFTKFSKAPKLSDLQFDGNDQLQRSFPQLVSMYAERALDCHTIFAEASMELMTDIVPKGAELGIHFEFASACDLDPNDFSQCRTRFFDDGVLVEQSAGRVGHDKDPHNNRITVPFGSEFWAQKITHLANLLREAAKRRSLCSGGEDPTVISEESATRLKDRARDELERLSAVQEIFAMRKGAYQPQKMLIIYWTFNQAVHVGTGETTWRNLVLPTAECKGEPAYEASFEPIPDGLGSNPLPDVSQPFDQHNFDLDDLSSIALAGISNDVGAPVTSAGIYSNVDVDFTGGHIQICMEPALPIDDYADTSTHFIDDLQQHARQWPIYPSYLDPGAYSAAAHAGVSGLGKDEAGVPSADYLASPLSNLKSEHGVLSGL